MTPRGATARGEPAGNREPSAAASEARRARRFARTRPGS
jgi:hypothetical protein